MTEDKNALSDWLDQRFRDPIAQIEDRDHEGFVFGRSEAEIEDADDDEGALQPM